MNPLILFTLVWIGARYGSEAMKCRTREDWKALFAKIKEKEFIQPAAAVTAATIHSMEKVDDFMESAYERYHEKAAARFDQFTEWVDDNFDSFQARVDAYMTRWKKTGTTEPKDPE